MFILPVNYFWIAISTGDSFMADRVQNQEADFSVGKN
jgi:hypothetical protein